jgi:hypothetical protein
VRSRAVLLHCTRVDGSRVQNPGADTFNQAVHLSGVGKLIAISMQWVISAEGCEGKSVRLYDGWRTAADADVANYQYVVFLQSARVCETCLPVYTDCKLLTFTFTLTNRDDRDRDSVRPNRHTMRCEKTVKKMVLHACT